MEYFTARIRKSQLQLSVQSQNGINGNSNILIFIFQVKGICLHEKMSIQLQTEPDNPQLTSKQKKKLVEGGCVYLFGFFKRCSNFSRRCKPRVRGENRTRLRIIKTIVSTIFSLYPCPFFQYSSVR